MTDQGDRAPRQEPATSIAGRTAAIDAAFADFPDFDDDAVPSAVAPPVSETPVDDDQPDSASTDTKPAPKADDKTVTESERPVEDQPVSPASKDPLEAPKHWSKDRREKFNALLQSLPDDAKELTASIILDRNKEANVAVTKAQQEAAQFRRTHEAIGSVFGDDHRKQMQAAGMDEIAAVRYLVAQHDALNRDPVTFLKAVIRQAGVSAEQLFGQAQAASQQPNPAAQPPAEAEWRDPDVVALEQRLAKLQEAEERRQQQAAEHQRNQQVSYQKWFADQCTQFEYAIGDDGNAKYPHLSAVMDDMTRIIKADPAFDEQFRTAPQQALETVYNKALRLNPEIYQQQVEEEVARRLQAAEAQNAVKKAQIANTRKGAPGANGQAQVRQRMTREEAINKAMADLGIA